MIQFECRFSHIFRITDPWNWREIVSGEIVDCMCAIERIPHPFTSQPLKKRNHSLSTNHWEYTSCGMKLNVGWVRRFLGAERRELDTLFDLLHHHIEYGPIVLVLFLCLVFVLIATSSDQRSTTSSTEEGEGTKSEWRGRLESRKTR